MSYEIKHISESVTIHWFSHGHKKTKNKLVWAKNTVIREGQLTNIAHVKYYE